MLPVGCTSQWSCGGRWVPTHYHVTSNSFFLETKDKWAIVQMSEINFLMQKLSNPSVCIQEIASGSSANETIQSISLFLSMQNMGNNQTLANNTKCN